MKNENYILISKEEYTRLIKNSDFLDALIEFGVDNWDGYCEAIRSLELKENPPVNQFESTI